MVNTLAHRIIRNHRARPAPHPTPGASARPDDALGRRTDRGAPPRTRLPAVRWHDAARL
ncbi:hypothetical protein Sme01_43380 [Sphaerisporangium melleum]|uniref:Uncharacterized protein n=1 Tax=Sphaerisporangium melleum TaxID=321316 RepID=A0A917QYW7_9ACTN|nr:hypothetical protein GCM10007964_20340 [Sphaerisporangium melleum]GII71862.1 hypothetical protein Sme01_43380 [Sphaerisporangium melleum]